MPKVKMVDKVASVKMDPYLKTLAACTTLPHAYFDFLSHERPIKINYEMLQEDTRAPMS